MRAETKLVSRMTTCQSDGECQHHDAAGHNRQAQVDERQRNRRTDPEQPPDAHRLSTRVERPAHLIDADFVGDPGFVGAALERPREAHEGGRHEHEPHAVREPGRDEP